MSLFEAAAVICTECLSVIVGLLLRATVSIFGVLAGVVAQHVVPRRVHGRQRHGSSH